MEVELRHLRAFVAVAKHRSYTAASRELLITQPALSRTIQQLEASVRTRLLHRTSRTVELTEAGGELLERVSAALHDLDTALATVSGHAGLRIGFQWALPADWISELLTSFETSTGATATLLRRDDIPAALASGDIDVALARSPLEAPGITETALFDETRVAAVPAASPLAERAELYWSQLPEQPIVINTVSGATYLELWPPENRPRRSIECGSYDEWLTIIAAGRGIGTTTPSAAEAHTHARVTYLPLREAPPVTLRLAWPARLSGDPLLRRFTEIAHATPIDGG